MDGWIRQERLPRGGTAEETSIIEHSPSVPQGIRALSPNDYSFFGFDDISREIVRRLRRVEIRGGTPGVSIVEDAVYVPEELTGRDGVRLGERLQSLPESSVSAYDHEMDEEVVYLGSLFNHYGHFLMQSLARTWFLTEVSPSVRVVFDPPRGASGQPARWMPRIQEAFGVSPERILVPDAPTRLRRLIIPEPFFEPRGTARDRVVRAHEAMARPYQAVADRLATDTIPSEQPVYLSRRLLPPSQRTIVGEAQLEEVLRANGFRIVHTETMTFEDQVRLVNEHKDIFSNAGSAAHNVLFALHAPRLHLLTNGVQFSPDYFLYAHIVGAPTSFINCLHTDGRPRFKRAHKQTPHLLDAPKLIEYLDQRGFLSAPKPVWPVEYREELQARYDETWLYGSIRALNQAVELPADLELEAHRVAPSSWPVSLALARFYSQHDRQRADDLAWQFAQLAAAETDRERLTVYREEVADIASILARRSSPETAARLHEVAIDRFLVALMPKEQQP